MHITQSLCLHVVKFLHPNQELAGLRVKEIPQRGLIVDGLTQDRRIDLKVLS